MPDRSSLDAAPSPRAVAAVVLAAGKGTRMRSDLPKVLHPLAGEPMLRHVLRAVQATAPQQVVVVVGPDMAAVADEAAPWPTALQAEQRGTGDAVRAALPALAGFNGDVLVVYGDTPLVRAETLAELIAARRAADAAVAVLGMRPADPAAYGRLVTDADGALQRIVEFADADAETRAIGLCNAGLMAIDGARLAALIGALDADNAKGEFYLTDVVALARARGWACAVAEAPETDVLGINSRAELATAEAVLQRRLRARAMAGGATLVDPDSVFLCADTVLGRDVLVEPNVVFGPGVTVADRVTIRAFSHLTAVTLGDGVQVGPFARLRGGADLAAGAYVGNFVELKAARMGAGAKASHLTYLGDAEIGADSNIGAGTITCNYDGFQKHRTEIGAGAFIGSNSALVAPVRIGPGAIVGAGSTITRDVPGDALAVARGQQAEKPGWAARFRALKQRLRAG